FLMKGGADAIIAEECVQETMVAVWNKAHLFDPTRAAASTWIFTIARNKRIDTARRNNRPEPDVLPSGNETEPDASEIISIQEETTLLAQAVKELPEKQRIIVERAFYNDLSHQEIANETGLPLGTIKSRIRLALQRLRHNMK
ncbi:sigma-70 family RNA polymerase sigma factor, partial [Amylibacter sp.]|nr:sigma-70 family RNA polymerase sigma factor [Amylibacter sp.]